MIHVDLILPDNIQGLLCTSVVKDDKNNVIINPLVFHRQDINSGRIDMSAEDNKTKS